VTDARRYFVRTFGCQMNEHDSERIAGLLEADGMEAAATADEADVVVLNTCCIRENADNKLYGTLGHLKSLKDRRPGMQIMVGGCLAQKDRDAVVDRAGHVDVVFGTHNVHRAVELLHEAGATRRSVVEILEETVAEDHDTFPSALPVRREVPWAGWVTIQIGCDNACAFCIVPAVRGREISRPFADVVAEVEAAAADGVTEVTLLGQNVNSYGRDLSLAARQAGEDVRVRPLFAELLRAIGDVEGIRRVRYTSPHPKDLRTETIAAMAETPEVCEHLHLPLQSGSDRVLAAMHRGYTAERYLERRNARNIVDRPTVIIALTAQALPEDRERALTAGCTDYVSKPIKEEVLFRMMAEHLGLQFIYAELNQSLPDLRQLLLDQSLTVEELAVMPRDWVQELYRAAVLCQDRVVQELLQQIPAEYTSLVWKLEALVHNFEFQPIMDISRLYLGSN